MQATQMAELIEAEICALKQQFKTNKDIWKYLVLHSK